MFLFRPPYGDYDSAVIKTAQKCGYVTLTLCFFKISKIFFVSSFPHAASNVSAIFGSDQNCSKMWLLYDTMGC